MTHTRTPRRSSYAFAPASRSGLVAGLRPRQVVVAGASLALALALAMSGELLAAVVVAALGATLTWVPAAGASLGEWLADAAAWLVRVVTGRARCDAKPLAEWSDADAGGVTVGLRRVSATVAWALLGVEDAQPFVLRSGASQDAALADWADWLRGALAAPEVREVGWLTLAAPSAVGGPAGWLAARAAPRDPDALGDYEAALGALGASATDHAAWVRLALACPPGDEPHAARVAAQLAAQSRSMRLVPLDADAARRVAEQALVPWARAAAARRSTLGEPLAPVEPVPPLREDAALLRLGHQHVEVWHADELARVPVAADGLSPLLAGASVAGVTRVTWGTMRSASSWRAERRVEATRTAIESEARTRARAGGVPRLSTERELRAVEQRGEELLSGHVVLAHDLYVALVAPTRRQLEAARSALGAAASASGGVALRRLGVRSRAALGSLVPELATSPRPRRVVAPHEDTDRHARAIWPGMALGQLPAVGVAIGRDAMTGGAVAIDPWGWYEAGVVTSPSIFVLGEVGKGKSACVKALVARSVGVFGRRACVVDPKGEYGPLADALGVPSVRLEPGGPERLDPLEPMPGEEGDVLARRRAGVLGALGAVGLGRPLAPAEEAGLAEAARRLGRDALLPLVVEALLAPDAAFAAALGAEPGRVADELRDLGLALRGLTSGRLAGMLDAPSTVRLDASLGLHLDLSACWADRSILPAVMVAATSWITAALAADGPPTHLVVDEAWAVLSDRPELASWLAGVTKLARSLGVAPLFVAHRVTDLAAAGEDSSAAAKRARGLLEDTPTRVCFAAAPGEQAALADALGLAEDEVVLVSSLPRGRCLLVAGERRALVDVMLTDRERAICDTDQRMRA